MNSHNNYTEIWVSPDEMEKICADLRNQGYIFFDQDPRNLDHIRDSVLIKPGEAYLANHVVSMRLTYRIGKEYENVNCYLDGREYYTTEASGKRAFQALQKSLGKNKLIPMKDPPYLSPKAMLWFNPKYMGQRIEGCFSYDINSAYANAMLQPIPDVSRPYISDDMIVPDDDYIGFDIEGNLKHAGCYAHWIFPLISSPFEKFVRKWYLRKKNARTIEEKLYAKQILNFSVGYLVYVNPFIRANILGYCNELIESLMDENTLYCNTDSIISSQRRPDLEENMGLDIGQWKIDHRGSFAYNFHSAYQWNNEIPSWRGIPKSAFKENFDILKDPRPDPDDGNIFTFDFTKQIFMRRKE